MTKKIRVLGLDPRIGISIVDYYEDTDIYQVIYFDTLSKTKFGKTYSADRKIFSDSLIFLAITKDYLKKIMDDYQPDIVVTEDAFLRVKYVSAFRVLTAWITTVAIVLYCDYKKYLHTISPKEIKLRMTGSAKAEKSDMLDALLRNKKVIFLNESYIDELTEHSVDATCCAIVKIMMLKK